MQRSAHHLDAWRTGAHAPPNVGDGAVATTPVFLWSAVALSLVKVYDDDALLRVAGSMFRVVVRLIVFLDSARASCLGTLRRREPIDYGLRSVATSDGTIESEVGVLVALLLAVAMIAALSLILFTWTPSHLASEHSALLGALLLLSTVTSERKT